jgi:hypothetical protein
MSCSYRIFDFVNSSMTRIYSGLFALSLIYGCGYYRPAYYLSPQNANSNPYHERPMKSDSLNSALYANAVFFNGSANYSGTDHNFGFEGSLHRSNQFSVFQSYYGANITMGSYHVGDYYNYNYGYNNPFDTTVHIPGSGNFFGSFGVSGGINLVATHQHRKKNRHSEWRILGIETSIQKEFGNYAVWRDKLPDSLANIIYSRHFSAYLGLYTEWVWTNKHNTELGFKLAMGEDLDPGSCYRNYLAESILPLHTVSITYHVTKSHFTGFVQTNFGTYASNIQFGFSYRLGKK